MALSLHKSLITLTKIIIIPICKYSKLAEVGKLEKPKSSGTYAVGQFLLHKVFAYRGVILFPWRAKVYDRDKLQPKKGEKDAWDSYKQLRPKIHIFYQVLIDQRDCQYVKIQNRAVTLLGEVRDSTQHMYVIPGLDYVAHKDILPYQSTEDTPLDHELFENFLKPKSTGKPPFEATDMLLAWQSKCLPWLKSADVHVQTTQNIRITVTPFYMGCREKDDHTVYWWRYSLRLENLGIQAVKLRERHLRIFSLTGNWETVKGKGVAGHEPLLGKESPAFQYSSHVSLHTPSGHMCGTFKMERADGHIFECRIPPFSLDSYEIGSNKEDVSSNMT